MPHPVDQFLRRAIIQHEGPRLGRVFAVTRESWSLKDDPQVVEPQTELLASWRTASEAADFAREAAAESPEHGFHKPSGAWWGSDGVTFHRFVVHAGERRRRKAVWLGAGLAGLAGVALFGWLRSGRGKTQGA